MQDLIIIGAGPAGISAALYAARANLNILVLYKRDSELKKSKKIDNYYGFENGISGSELFEQGIKQAKNLGITLKEEEVIDIDIEMNNTFKIKTNVAEYQAKSIILATGSKKILPNIPGLKELEGNGVSYCAICDGFFYKGKDVAVIGDGKYAISEAGHLENLVSNLVILTNGKEIESDCKYKVDVRKIVEVKEENGKKVVVFEEGEKILLDGIFIAEGIAGGVNFAKKLGMLTNGNNISVDENMRTNIPGIYACGDITGKLLQVNKSAYEGAKASLDVIKYLKKL